MMPTLSHIHMTFGINTSSNMFVIEIVIIWSKKGVKQGLHIGVVLCGCEQRTKSQEVGIARWQPFWCVCLAPHVTQYLVSIRIMGLFLSGA